MREALNRQIDLLEANQMTDKEWAAAIARAKDRPPSPDSLDDFRRELDLPEPTGERPKSLRVTRRVGGPVWIQWPDGETCEHPSLTDARSCPKAAA